MGLFSKKNKSVKILCPSCHRKFKTIGKLRTHILRKHGDNAGNKRRR